MVTRQESAGRVSYLPHRHYIKYTTFLLTLQGKIKFISSNTWVPEDSHLAPLTVFLRFQVGPLFDMAAFEGESPYRYEVVE